MTMGLKIYVLLAFFIGIEVGANPFDRCMSIIKVEDIESIAKLSSEEQMNYLCTNVTSFLRCADNVVREEFGFGIREFSELLKGSEIGSALTLVANVRDLVEEVCIEGSELREDLLKDADCLEDSSEVLLERCQRQAKDAYEAYRESQNEIDDIKDTDENCMISGYQFGCYGVAIREECSDRAYETYKTIVKKVGLFKSGICSLNVVETIKTKFIDGLDLSDSQKDIYRVIVNLRRRRK